MTADEHLLSRLIAHVQPRTDADAMAAHLLREYGSLGPVLESDPADLARLNGMNEALARLLHLIPQLSRYVACEQARGTKKLNHFRLAGEYLRRLYIGAHNERFYLLCLDARGNLLDCAMLQEGSVEQAAFPLRLMLETIVRTGATAVVLSHNHPGGTRDYSHGDILCTQLALQTLLPIEVLVLDHILIADGEPVSLYGNPNFPEVLFTRQRPGEPLILGWLNDEEENV